MARSDLMFVVFVLVAAVVLFAVVVVATGRGDVLDTEDAARTPAADLPERAIGAADLDRLRFTVVARGYRMDQVDDVVDRLGRELDLRDRRIAELEARTGTPAPARPAPGRPAAGRPAAGTGSATPLPRRRPGETEAEFGR